MLELEVVKEIIKDTIDRTDNTNELIQNVIDAIYLRGQNDMMEAILNKQQKEHKFIQNADEIVKRFIECKNSCDSIYDPCEAFRNSANDMLNLVQELIDLYKKENLC